MMIASARRSRSWRSGSATEVWCRTCSGFIGLLPLFILREEPENGETELSARIPLQLLHPGLDYQVNRFMGCDCHIEVYLNGLEVERPTHLQTGSSSQSLSFLRRHGVPVPDSPWGMPTPGQMWGSFYAPTFPDRLINDGDILRVGPREVHVVWTPGHTPGHCCFYLPQDKVLIVGDHLLPKITPHIGVYPGGPDNPLGDFIESLKKVQKLDVELVLPAHGAVYKDHRYPCPPAHPASRIPQTGDARHHPSSGQDGV